MISAQGAHITIIGCGNIGSYTCELAARLPEVSRITIIDSGVYESDNLTTQGISIPDVNQPKALAQARLLRRLRPGIRVDGIHSAVEQAPLGRLRCDILLACLDSRISRVFVNQWAFRLGIRYIDAGVLASEQMARVDVFQPGPDSACMECAFGRQHYDNLETRYPCQAASDPIAPPTGAPAYLGALAASLQVAECRKLLGGCAADHRCSRQLLLSLGATQLLVSNYRRNPQCRFAHNIIAPSPAPARLRLIDALSLCGSGKDPMTAALAIPHRGFVSTASCPGCCAARPVYRFLNAEEALKLKCPKCGCEAPVHPFLLAESLTAAAAPPYLLHCSMRSLGVRIGDLFSVSTDGSEEGYFVLGAPSCSRSSA